MKKITPDKWKYFYVCIALGAPVYGLAIILLRQQPVTAFLVSAAIIIAICYGFELFSLLTGKGHYEFKDALAGIVGGAIGVGLTTPIKLCI
jgi:hypothetical protein